MLNKIKGKSALLVRKKIAGQSDSWNGLAKDRFIKQHGDVDHLPEGDAHAVKTFDDFSLKHPAASQEETDQALSSLESQIKVLKEKEKNRPVQPPPPAQTKPKDDFYDDWLDD